MQTYLNVVQILISTVLTVLVLMQVREQGAGLFGGAQATFRTRRGVEKLVFQFTIVLAALFIIVSLLSVGLYRP
jgi:preprotein translocase subunit SecG